MTHFADKEYSGDVAGTRGLMHAAGGSGEVTVVSAMDCAELAPPVPGYIDSEFSNEPGRVAARVCFRPAEEGREQEVAPR